MIYLDSAATTLQKPRSVANAVNLALQTMASPGRGGHKAAAMAAQTAFSCREEAASLFDVESPEQIVFTFNATHALNLAIHSLIKPGSTVLISGYEHNAVTRTIFAIPDIHIKVAKGTIFDQNSVLEDFSRKLTPEVDAVITTHVSNVFGFILPLEQIANLCRERGMPLIVDASQSAGVLDISMKKLQADFIAMPGHKGLYGPQGTGLLICGSRETRPLLSGGTGSNSRSQDMPEFLPDRLEAGTHNMPGIAGLLEGIRFVRGETPLNIRCHENNLLRELICGLQESEETEVFAGLRGDTQCSVVSFRKRNWDCEALGEALAQRGIAVRAGLHCAPLAHESAGTLVTGTVRVSVSAFTTQEDIKVFLNTIRTM